MSLAAVVLSLAPLLGAQPPAAGSFVAVSVRYSASTDLDRMRQDFRGLRAAGFNAVATSISWREGEPKRGVYSLLAVDRVLAVATEADLRVQLSVDTAAEPAWKNDGTNALAGQFFAYVQRRFAANPATLSITPSTPGSPPARRVMTLGDGPGSLTPRQARRGLWTAFASGVHAFELVDVAGPVSPALLALGETVGVLTRNQALFAPLKPRPLAAGEVTIEGARSVTVQILESPEAMVIVAVNHAAEVSKATITFQPGIPEAIWQNMEEGISVQFVMSPKGPVLVQTFAPEDVLVLAIRKRLR